jgi:hypothetical protein
VNQCTVNEDFKIELKPMVWENVCK